MNPLYQQLAGTQAGAGQGIGGMLQMMVPQFAQWRAGLQGDPQQIIQGMLNSGKITQQQYNAAVQAYQQYGNLFRR